MVNVAINGFGRIGRNTLRAAIKEGIFDKINYVAINDPGLKPEDARGNLTFNTYTICGYTYTLNEWKHILDMRLRNKTGIAHPDASIVAKQISRIINDRMQQYIPSFEI